MWFSDMLPLADGALPDASQGFQLSTAAALGTPPGFADEQVAIHTDADSPIELFLTDAAKTIAGPASKCFEKIDGLIAKRRKLSGRPSWLGINLPRPLTCFPRCSVNRVRLA